MDKFRRKLMQIVGTTNDVGSKFYVVCSSFSCSNLRDYRISLIKRRCSCVKIVASNINQMLITLSLEPSQILKHQLSPLRTGTIYTLGPCKQRMELMDNQNLRKHNKRLRKLYQCSYNNNFAEQIIVYQRVNEIAYRVSCESIYIEIHSEAMMIH